MIKEYLNQSYPLSGNKWKIAILFCIYIGLFMLIFQPFGLSNYYGTYKTFICFGYGFVTLAALLFDLFVIQLIFKKWFINNQWTVKKQIIWQLWIIFSIGAGNFIYTSLLNSSWSFYLFMIFQAYTLAVGIIPIVTITVIQQNSMLSNNLKTAQEFNASLHPIEVTPGSEVVSLQADNDKDLFEVELSNLLYIESTGNYIEINYYTENQLKNLLLRSTLKRTEFQLKQHSSILKCHRAFLVNTTKIEQVKGNSQGLRLALKHTDTEIPVSRNFSKNLKDKLNSRL